MHIRNVLNEVEVIDTRKPLDKQAPLQKEKSIRVYHGFNSAKEMVDALTYGLSGNVKAKRLYSYEANNNPKGLFVTIDFDAAKRFGSYIIQFHAKIDELEAPVWKSGAFTTQGQKVEYYDGDTERKRDQKKLLDQQKKNKNDAIRKSYKPDVAQRLLDFPENQALFVGDLNPNSIQTVWIQKEPSRPTSSFERYSRKEVLNLAMDGKLKTRDGGFYKHSPKATDDFYEQHLKIFKPRENASFDELVKRVGEKMKFLNRNKIEDILRSNTDYIRRYVWNERQYKQVIDSL